MIHFDTDEMLIKEIRGPRASILLRVIIVALLAILPLIFFNVFPQGSSQHIALNGSPKGFFIFCYSLWLLIVWVDFFIWWMRYCLHTLILTDSRIFDLTKKKFFTRDITSVRLEDIEDITVSFPTALSRFSQLGKLVIRSKGNASVPWQEVVFNNTFEPEAVKQLILNAQRARREKIATVSYTPQIVQQ